MKIENYLLEITEIYMRYYYSSKPQVIQTITTQYDLVEKLEIPTSVASIVLSSYIISRDEVLGIYLEYDNQNFELQTVALYFDDSIEIKLTTGNPDVSRTSLCTLRLVKK